MPYPSLHAGFWSNVGLHRLPTCCHKSCGFICAASLLCREDIVPLLSYTVSASYILPVPSLKRGCAIFMFHVGLSIVPSLILCTLCGALYQTQ